jgi:hypothetical protein
MAILNQPGFANMAGAPQALQMAYMRDPRLRLAQQLQLQGADSSPVQHWTQGAARLAQALAGGYVQDKADAEYAKQAGDYQNDMRALYAPVQEMKPGQSGAGPRPDAQMTTRAPSIQEILARGQNLQSPYSQDQLRQFQMMDMQQQAAQQAEARKPFNLRPGERRMTPDGRVMAENPVAEKPQAPPASVAEFQFAQQDGFRGNFMDFQRAKAEAGRVPEQAGAGPFSGNSMDAQARNFLLNPNADVSSPQYALAYQYLTQPKLQMAPGPDGVPVMSMVTPTLPPNIRPPVFSQPGAQPAPAQAPAAPQGAAPQLPPAAGQPAPQAGAPVTVPGATITPLGTGRPKDLSEAQAKANLFGGQMVQAENILSGVQVPSNASLMAWRNLPEGAVNMVLPENDQKYFNALRLFASGVLRKETGAAFTANELLDVQSRFFPMPGDTAAVREQKAQARRQVQESIRTELPGGEFRGIVSPPVYGSQDMQGGGQTAPGAVRTWNPATGQLE